MTEIRIGYVRCSTDRQDLAAQHEALASLGVTPDRNTDKGLFECGLIRLRTPRRYDLAQAKGTL